MKLTFEGTIEMGARSFFPNIALTCPAGEVTCLLGPSGVGKTTLLRFVAGLATGAEVSARLRFGASQEMPQIGMMTQSGDLLPWASVLANITISDRLTGRAARPALAEAIMRQTGLYEHREKRPHSLSGGERQRVVLARMIYTGGEIFLLDEPFSALDAKTKVDMQDLALASLARKTVLLVTHDPLEAARIADHLYVLTKSGLQSFDAPQSPTPRPVSDPQVLSLQAQLLCALGVA